MQWGTACDARFTEVSAAVACRQMGLPLPAKLLPSGPLYGAINAPTWLHYIEWWGLGGLLCLFVPAAAAGGGCALLPARPPSAPKTRGLRWSRLPATFAPRAHAAVCV